MPDPFIKRQAQENQKAETDNTLSITSPSIQKEDDLTNQKAAGIKPSK